MNCKGAMRILLALASDKPPPDLHSAQPVAAIEPTLQSMVKAERAMLTALLNAPSAGA